uniref:Single domain-containing protein n=1 Tax=Parasteatoda tepidariorum TaxID=114398 RepID=A0A2L2Y447_PARTP
MLRNTVVFTLIGLVLVVMTVEAGKDCGKHKDGETFGTEHPCARNTCNDGNLSAVGCGQFQLLKGSKCRREKGKGPYPKCCEHPVCPGDPTY